MIEILNADELARARATGALVGDILQALKARAAVGVNLLDLDRWAKQLIEDAGANPATSTTPPRSAAARSATTCARP